MPPNLFLILFKLKCKRFPPSCGDLLCVLEEQHHRLSERLASLEASRGAIGASNPPYFTAQRYWGVYKGPLYIFGSTLCRETLDFQTVVRLIAEVFPVCFAFMNICFFMSCLSTWKDLSVQTPFFSVPKDAQCSESYAEAILWFFSIFYRITKFPFPVWNKNQNNFLFLLLQIGYICMSTSAEIGIST